MGRGPHLYRRGAVYYWQRRLPNQIARHLRISHVKMNLGTKDVAVARLLVPPLDAKAMEVFMTGTQNLSREQMSSIFKSVLIEHQAKLGLLADIERAKPTATRSALLEDEIAQGVAYTLLADLGVDAGFPLSEQKRWIQNGRDGKFVIKVLEHLERLRDEKGIKISRQRLAGHVEKVGAEANAVNLTRAQPIYLRALGAALLAAGERYNHARVRTGFRRVDQGGPRGHFRHCYGSGQPSNAAATPCADARSLAYGCAAGGYSRGGCGRHE